MAITEEARFKIYEAFRRSYGDEVANGLMELLPPLGWADVATKRDLDALEERIGLRFAVVDERLDAMRFEFGERLERELRRMSARFTASLFAGLTLFGVADRLLA